MKQHGSGGTWVSLPVSPWQLEEAQVFWAKGEQGLALGLLRQMIHNLEEKVKHSCTISNETAQKKGRFNFVIALKTIFGLNMKNRSTFLTL